MPTKTKQPRDYSKGKIYKIICLTDPSVVYYGSTTQDTLADRMKDHRHKYAKYLKTGKMERSSSLVLEKGKSIILLVEPWPCTSKDELLMREGKWMLENECVNKQVAGAVAKAGGKKEYYKMKFAERYANKKEECLQASLNWRNKNKQKVLEASRERYQTIRKTPTKCKYCNSMVSLSNMRRHEKQNKSCLKIQQEANSTQ